MLQVVEVELVPGLVVSGKYRLERAIGRGGFGVVWAAVDITTGEPRALKCLTEEGATDSKRQERLRREAQAMAAITHPHIARVFGLEELPAGTPFIVMELLAGRTLHAHLAKGPVSVPQARGILIQILDALRTVHARGIIHRDLKPANVIIVDDRTAKVLDFGIAKDLSSSEKHKLTTTGTALGTLNYMAPEQIFGERNLDGRCDMWALGIVAHECLTLRRPTDGEGDNSGQVLKAILDGNFPRLSALVPGMPRDMDELVARMLLRNPAERPTSEEAYAILVRPAAAPTVPRSLGKTNPMDGTLPLSDAPLFARTVAEERFASSQWVPSTVVPSTRVPSTVVPSTVVPSTVVPSTAVPSTVMPSTVASPPATPQKATLASAHGPGATIAAAPLFTPTSVPAITPAHGHARPTADPTYVRPRETRSSAPWALLAIGASVLVIGIVVFLFASARGHKNDTATATTPSATTSAVSQPVASASAYASATATASVPPPASASASAPASAAPVAPPASPSLATRKSTPVSPVRSAAPRPPAGKDDPPISNERF